MAMVKNRRKSSHLIRFALCKGKLILIKKQ
jgi:hypothetical protein